MSEPAEDTAPTSAPAPLNLPADQRELPLAVLTFVACVFLLQWAAAFFIPVLLGLMLSYAATPAVDRLQRALRLPRALACTLLMSTLIGGSGWAAYALADDATAFVESLPEAAQKLRQTLRETRSSKDSALDKMQAAAAQLEQAAQESTTGKVAVERGVTRVQIEKPRFNFKDYLWSGVPSAAVAVGQATAVLFVTFFLLSAGDTFRRKLVRLAGPDFAHKKLTVQAMDEISEQIQRYLLVQLLISAVVGVATGLAYWAIGVEHAMVWGLLAFALNFIPYIGSLVLTAGSALVGFVQFASFDMALLVAGVSLAIHVVSGSLLTPWLTSRASRMNPVAVFVGLLAFGWLWGVWGLVLGVPLLLMVKAVSDRVDGLRPVGELLGR